MKTKIFVLIAAVATMMSCTTEIKNKAVDIHEEHPQVGRVMLTRQQQEALDLQWGSFQMRNLTTVVKINGELMVAPENIAEVTAIVGGNVKAIKAFHGDKIKKGQVLALLEHPDYIQLQEDFLVMASSLEFQEKEYERQKQLFENKVGSGKDFQEARANFLTSRARYEGLKSRLQLLHLSPEEVMAGHISNSIEIVSPMNGFLKEVDIKLGTYVDARRKMFEIVDNNAIHADFMIYEKDVHLVKEGQNIHFTISNRSEPGYTATVFAIGKEFESNTRSVHIHARINEPPAGLISGMYITGHLHTDSHFTRTLPRDAIVTEGDKSFIFILDDEVPEEKTLDKGEKFFRRFEVIPGLTDEGFTGIKLLDSLPENTQVVLNAAYYLLSEMGKGETSHEH